MKIIMTETRQGSENGIIIKTYYSGETYDIGKELYDSFKKMKCCKDFAEIEEKKIDDSPKNKMIKPDKNKDTK